ncbi:MAG: sigma-70 family RNA polymerase sigma factor [Bacteroidota bacterium]|nr:sigma-70 family RNA polymerase sigma factor [Bacteroidota bacterium]
MLLHTFSDKDLVSAYLKGKPTALDVLVKRHETKVMNFIFSKIKNHQLSEDIFQEAFLKVMKSLKSNKYNEEGKFLPWLMRISHNLVIDHFRKTNRQPRMADTKSFNDFDIFDVIGNGEISREHELIKEEQMSLLKKLIDDLPVEQREVLLMRHYEDMSFKEIAEKSGVSINTALGRMRYALINIRKLMKEQNVSLSIN